MADDHETYVEWAAAYALGALDAADRVAFEGHLEDCPRCAAELVEVAPIPALLHRLGAPPATEVTHERTASKITSAAHDELSAIRRSARRWRVTAAAAVLLALVGAMTAILNDGPRPARENAQVATIVFAEATDTIVQTTAKGWGTEIHIELTGLEPRARYTLWVVDASESWSTAASWSPTASGNVRLTGASATATSDVLRIVVTSDDPSDILVEAAV